MAQHLHLLDTWGSWPAAIEAMKADLETAPSDTEKVQALWCLALIHLEELNDPAAGIDALEQLAELDFEHLQGVARLAAAYRHTGRWKELATLQLDRLDVTESATERAALLLDVASIYLTQLANPASAALVIEKALAEEAVPSAANAEALLQLAIHSGDPASIVDRVVAVLQNPELNPESAFEVICLAASAFEASGQHERAHAWWERAASTHPGHPRVYAALHKIYTDDEDWESLADLLTRRAEQASADEQLAVWLELIALLRTHPTDPTQLTFAIEQARQLAPDHPDILTALLEQKRAAGDLVAVARALEEQAASLDDNAALPLLLEATEIWRAMPDHADDARRVLRRALQAAPEHVATLLQLRDLALQAEDWAEACSMEERLAELTDDPQAQLDALVRRGKLLAERLQQVDLARSVLVRAHQLAPENIDAARALLDLLRRGEDELALVELQLELAALSAWALEARELRVNSATRLAATLSDKGRALTVLQAQLQETPHDVLLLRQAVELARETEQDAIALQLLETLSEIDSTSAGPLLDIARMARAADDDITQQENAWLSVLERDPDHAEALEALDSLYGAMAEWEKQLSMLRRRVAATIGLRERADLLARVGDLLRLNLQRPDEAWPAYEEALALDPTHVMSAAPLAQAALEAEQWARIPGLFGVLVADPDFASDPEVRASLLFNVARAHAELAQTTRATAQYEAILALQPENWAVMRNLAFLYADTGRPTEAEAQFAELLAWDDSEDALADRISLRRKAAENASALGQTRVAAERYRSLLALSPFDEEALRAVAALDGEHDPNAGVNARERLLELAATPTDRLRLLVELGDLHAEAERIDEAVRYYQQAVAIDPNSRAVLHKLLQLFNNAEMWREAAEVLGQLSRLEADPTRRLKLLFAVAAIFRDQLEDTDHAMRVFNLILDEDAEQLEAFEAIDRMLQAAQDYRLLEQNYRRMIERALHGADELKIMLLSGLGRIYHRHLGQNSDALATWQLALRIDPSRADIWEYVLEAMPNDGTDEEHQVAVHRKLLELKPERLDSYHELFAIWNRRREWDRALRAAAVLDVMGQATPDEQQFYSALQTRTLPLARSPLTAAHWNLLRHPDLDPALTQLFATLGRTLSKAVAQGHARWGIDPRAHTIDLRQENAVTNLFMYTSQIIGVEMPVLFNPDNLSGIFNAHTSPRALVLGTDVASGEANRRMVFRIGHAMTLMRDEFYLASAYSSRDSLKAFVYGTLAAFTGQIVPDPSQEAVESCLTVIQKQSAPVLADIGKAVTSLFEAGRSPDISAWMAAADFTAARVGLLLCGDLSRALQALRDTPESLGQTTLQERSRDLVEFSLTDDYEEVRASLKLGVGQQ
jgi:tetratricopeptide (TPR) repeat protein